MAVLPPANRSPSGPNPFASSGVDRRSAVRPHRDQLDALVADPRATVVLVRPPHILFTTDASVGPAVVSLSDIDAGLDELILLGIEDGVPRWALDVGDADATAELGAAGSEWVALREVGGQLSQRDGSLMAQAQGMVNWARRHRYCGCCGSPTKQAEGGYLRTCTDAACATQHFPRLDPAVIMLVTSKDRCVLGRQAGWPRRMYSALAGFVEPGESLEDAVVREVFEEVGIVVGEVAYQSSQPWPFPSSLMLGFEAEAASTVLEVDHGELQDARWYGREELKELAADGGIVLPGAVSIARRLIDGWLACS